MTAQIQVAAVPVRRTQAAHWALESRRVLAEIAVVAAAYEALTDLAQR